MVPTCSPESKIVDESIPTLTDCLQRASRLVDSTTGVISSVELEDLQPGEPEVYFARAHPSRFNPLNGKESINFGDAVSLYPERALMKSIGECLERYCSAYIDEALLVGASWEELDGEAVHPEDLVFFTEEQLASSGFPFSQLKVDTKTRWIQCSRIGATEKVWVPAQLVFIPCPIHHQDDLVMKDQISTGMACAPDTSSALYKGILEVIERDAFMITWLNRISPPRILLDSLRDPLALGLLERLSGLPVEFVAYRLTLDIDAHVILVLVEGTSGVAPHSVMGLGADLDPERALILALEEALLTFIGMGRYARSKPDFSIEPGYRNITLPTLHALAHAACPELKESLEFFRTASNTIRFSDLENKAHPLSRREDIDYLAAQIRAGGMDVLTFDMTTEDVDRAGFKVARVVIPGMQPLDISHDTRHLGGKRLRTVPATLNGNRYGNAGEFNPYPHAFP